MRPLFLVCTLCILLGCQPKTSRHESTTVVNNAGDTSTQSPSDSSAAGGADVGNGGDAVKCTKIEGSELDGLYSLDFLMTEASNAPPIQEVKSLNGAFERVFNQLKRLHPQLAWSFYDFHSQIENHTNYEVDRIWEASSNDLLNITDEKLVKRLPKNCTGEGSAQIYQAVIRQKRATHTTYHYAETLHEELKQKPVQYSFLMVHEWLWDFTEDVAAIRQLNRILHSTQLESMSPESFTAMVGNLGLKVSLPLINRGLYKPKERIQANDRGDFSRCTFVPDISDNPGVLILGRGQAPTSCWNFNGVNSLRYLCEVSTEDPKSRPRTLCKIDPDQFDMQQLGAVYDVETIEIVNHRHLILTFVPGTRRSKKVTVDYFYSDYVIPERKE